MISILQKIIGAELHRKSRFRDEQNEFMPLSEYARLPIRLQERIARVFDIFPKKPWWPTSARNRINEIIRPDWLVVEFGSGMSTSWLAVRAGKVVAIESQAAWLDRVQGQLQSRNAKNVELIFFDKTKYDSIVIELDARPNLVIIDGARRKECIQWAFENVKPGGFIYLDNSDRPGTEVGTDGFGAREELLRLAKVRSASIEFLKGIPPGLLASAQGALVHISE